MAFEITIKKWHGVASWTWGAGEEDLSFSLSKSLKEKYAAHDELLCNGYDSLSSYKFCARFALVFKALS